MTGRRTWREAHRAARKACPAKGWIRACLPATWMTADTARRLGLLPGLASASHRAAVALYCAADERRKGRPEAARMWAGVARKANLNRHLTPCPALEA